jgi:predicted glutamine amidotransferase
MCELLLIVANRNVGISLSWKALQDRANQNPDGWGTAWIEDGSFRSKRKPEKLPGGAGGMKLVDGISTSQFLAHVRYNVVGRSLML